MEVPVKNQKGDTVDTINLDDAIFNVAMNQSLVHQALVIYQDNKRQGTSDTKTRGEVSGGGRKPWIQKHTGRARQGSIRAPQWRHGGIAFGPHPRDYHKTLPRRIRRQAVKCALSEKARRGHLVCLDSLDGVEGKTKSMVDLLNNLGVTGPILLVTQEPEEGVIRAARNLKNIWTLPVNLLNAHDLLRRETLIMTVAAARRAEELWANNPHRGWRSARLAAPAGAAVNPPEPAAGETASNGEGTTVPRRRRTRRAGEEAEQ
jgi:large subunit ribosomal protein L4